MARSVLVVASKTATSPQLIDALRGKADAGDVRVTLVMPCNGVGYTAKEETRRQVDAALASWREQGLTDVEGVVGDQDPLIAVHEAYDPLHHDEIIVSTLPGHASEWLRWDLPHRIARLTDAQVTHVLSSTPHAPLVWEKEPPKERPTLGPLSVLAWGRPKEETERERERERRLRELRR
jgi:hypothetical protein